MWTCMRALFTSKYPSLINTERQKMVSLNTDNTLHNILNIREDEVRCWAIIAAMLKPSSVLYDEWCATLYIMQQNECCIFCVWEISMCFEWVRFCQLYLWFYEKLFRYRDSIPHDAQIHECLKGQHSICSVLTSLSLSFFFIYYSRKENCKRGLPLCLLLFMFRSCSDLTFI